MKKLFLLTVLSGMLPVSMAGGIPRIYSDLSDAHTTTVYDRITADGKTRVRVLNIDTPEPAFVVKCDDAVVGYGIGSSFSMVTAPPAMLEMLEAMTTVDFAPTAKYQVVEPLQSTKGPIRWNQDSPYNDMCPYCDINQRSATGCVATAMAQLMYYYQWPLKGTGEHTYSPPVLMGNTLSADFGNTAYSWDAMLPMYNSESGDESRRAVAELMLHCGVAVDMSYGMSSGALDYDVPPALVNYFSYDGGLAYRKRENYATSDWLAIINDELVAGRMVLAYGRTQTSGHAFIFDGMDENGFIHVNWGWGGVSNGYFATSALTPVYQGIGGSEGGFNYSQRIITGIKPAVEGEVTDRHVELSSSEGLVAGRQKIQQGSDFTIRLAGKVTNQGWQTSTFDYAILLVDKNGGVIKVIEGPKGVTIAKDDKDYAPSFGTVNLGTIAPGEYTLYPACRDSEATGDWIRIRDDYTGYRNYLRVIASESEVTFEAPDYFNLHAIITEAPAVVYRNVYTRIIADVTNEGDVGYHGEVRASLRKGNTNVATIANMVIDLEPGETTNLHIIDSFKADPGMYKLVLIDDDGRPISETVDVEMIGAYDSGYLKLYANPEVVSNSTSHMEINITVKAEEGPCQGLIYCAIVSTNGDNTANCSLSEQYYCLDDNEVATITFQGPFENGIPGYEYKLAFLCMDGRNYIPVDDSMYPFTFILMESGISDVEVDDPSEYIYFDVLGRIVNPGHTKTYKKLRIKK